MAKTFWTVVLSLILGTTAISAALGAGGFGGNGNAAGGPTHDVLSYLHAPQAPSPANAPAAAGAAPSQNADPLYWLNHFDLLPGADEVTTSHASTSSGVGGGLTALVIESSTTGDVFEDGGNKVVQMAVQVPPGFNVTGVRVCYELTSNASFITQVRLAQVQNPPSSALVMLDDATNLTDVGPTCVDTSSTMIDPSAGALILDLRLDFENTSDKIAVRGLGLHLEAAATSGTQWLNHFDLMSGAAEVTTTTHSTTSGVGGGLTGVVIESTTTGEVFADGGNKVVQMAVGLAPGFTVTGVRVCYELSSNESFISQVRLAQVANPPSSALVMLDDATDLTNVGPSCVDTASTSIDPSAGALLLDLRLNFGNTSDKIVVRGVALNVQDSVGADSGAVKDFVSGLAPSDFSNKNHQKTILNKLDAVDSQIAGGDLCAAIDKLTHDLLPKTDGVGSPPDWVVTPAAQTGLESLLLDFIGALEAKAGTMGLACGTTSAVLWLNHFDLLAGGDEVTTSYASTSSGVGGGLTGTVIESSTTGDVFADGGNRVVQMAVEVPPGYNVTGVRVCYELTSNLSFISQVRLAQVQDPPSSALVMLDDPTDLTDVGPKCVDTAATAVDPAGGALLFDLRLDFGDTTDKIVVRAVALELEVA